MALTTKGLIIRQHNVGEADRFVTVLTDTLGVIRASVRGARRVHSRSGASTRLLSYAQLSLVKGRSNYIIETAAPLRVFFTVGSDVERLSLAQYFCELASAVAPQEEPAAPFLSLLLNALHLLEEGERDPLLIKAVTELRLLVMAGYTPELSGCRCGTAAPKALYFLPRGGVLRCEACVHEGGLALSPTVLAAMRHIVQGESAKAFSFRIPPDALRQLADISERFMTEQLARRFKTLEFYRTVAVPTTYRSETE